MYRIYSTTETTTYFQLRFNSYLPTTYPKTAYVCFRQIFNISTQKYADLPGQKKLGSPVAVESRLITSSSIPNNSNHSQSREAKDVKCALSLVNRSKIRKHEKNSTISLPKKEDKNSKTLSLQKTLSSKEKDKKRKQTSAAHLSYEQKESNFLKEGHSTKLDGLASLDIKRGKNMKITLKNDSDKKNSISKTSKTKADLYDPIENYASRIHKIPKVELINSLNTIHKKIKTKQFSELQDFEVKNRVDIVDNKLCDDALQRLRLSLDEYKGCDLIDLNPGVSLWSSKLHDLLRPRNHILMEPQHDSYMPMLKLLLDTPHSKYRLVPENGIDWAQLEKVLMPKYLPEQPILDSGDPRLQKVNKTLLVTANIGHYQKTRFSRFSSLGTLVIFQFLSAMRTNSLFQKYGRVRMLLWINPNDVKMMPKNIANMKKAALEATTCCQHIEMIIDADLESKKKREKSLDLQGVTSVVKKMKEIGLKIPEGRETKILKAMRAGETGREIEELSPKCLQKEIEEMNKAFADGEFQRSETNITLNSNQEKCVISRVTPEYSRMVELERRNKRRAKTTQVFFDLGDLYENILSLYQQLALTDNKEKIEALKKKIQEKTTTLNQETSSFAPLMAAEFQHLCDNRRIYNQSPPGLFWDRRTAEPLTAREDEFSPHQILSLMDIMPASMPSISKHPEYIDTVSFLISEICATPTHSLKHVLRSLAPGAEDWLLAQCPSLTDPLKNGCPDLELFSARCVTAGMIHEMCEAWLKWPFRPDRVEILHRLGSEVFYEKLDNA